MIYSVISDSSQHKSSLAFSEFELILFDIANYAFKPFDCPDKLILLLKAISKYTKSLYNLSLEPDARLNIDKIFVIKKQFHRHSLSQRTIVPKKSMKNIVNSKICENNSYRNLNGHSTEATLKLLKSYEHNDSKSKLKIGKHSRVASLDLDLGKILNQERKIYGLKGKSNEKIKNSGSRNEEKKNSRKEIKSSQEKKRRDSEKKSITKEDQFLDKIRGMVEKLKNCEYDSKEKIDNYIETKPENLKRLKKNQKSDKYMMFPEIFVVGFIFKTWHAYVKNKTLALYGSDCY